jgi:hypothetical protein
LVQPFEVANTPFRLITVTADKKRYRGSDTVNVTVVLSESVDEVEADFSILDTAFEAENLTIEETDTPGTYAISYRIDGIDNTNPPGIYQIPLSFAQGAVARSYSGLRVGYVGEVDNLLNAVDQVPTTTVVGPFPNGESPVTITDLAVSRSVILPLTSVIVTGARPDGSGGALSLALRLPGHRGSGGPRRYRHGRTPQGHPGRRLQSGRQRGRAAGLLTQQRT